MTSKEWKKCKIGELCNSVSDTHKRNDKKVILINTSDVFDGKILNNIPIENKNLKGQFKKTFKKDDILYSEIRPANRRFAYVNIGNTDNYIASTKLMVLRPNKNKILPKYLYLILKSDEIIKELQHLAETRSGTFPQITFNSELANIEILLPPLVTQDKIAHILSSLDDKIELNNKINQNLEQQAQAIFDKYIKIPCNYLKTGTIRDYCNVKSGFAFKSSWWKDSGVKVIKIKTIDNESINFTECSFVDKEKISIAEDFIVQGGDLLIAMTGATIGKFAIVPKIDEVLLVNQRVGKFFLGTHPIKKLPFLYCTLKQQDIINDIINKGQGSAQPNISSTDILNTSCYILENVELEKFNLICEPIFEKIITNKCENEKLTQLRDTLLPKLMSGEIDVDKI